MTRGLFQDRDVIRVSGNHETLARSLALYSKHLRRFDDESWNRKRIGRAPKHIDSILWKHWRTRLEIQSMGPHSALD